MKTRFVVSLAAALVLTSFVPTGAGAIGVGKSCGGFAGLQCDAGLFCQNKPGKCGLLDGPGTCTRVPKFCGHFVLPVCGCDGKTYNNDCERQQAMVSQSHPGKCN
jgi:hypothetical protein